MSAHILLVCADPGIAWGGGKGASVHLRSVARGMTELGCRITVLAKEGLGSFREWGEDPEFTRPREVDSVRRFFADPRDRSFREAGYVAANPWWLEALERRHATDPFDLVYERLSLWSDLGVRLRERLETPLVLEVNAPLRREQSAYRNLALATLAEDMERRNFTGADRAVVVSRWLETELQRCGVARERILRLPNIAEPDAFAAARSRPIETKDDPAGELVFGFSGSLKRWHGLRGFLEVFARVRSQRPAVRLEILGDGPEREELEALTSGLGLDRHVRFLGMVPHLTVPRVMGGWNVAVAPYPHLDDFYFSPLKIAEASAAGLPVVASAIGDIPEMLGEGRWGVLVEPENADAWVAALVDLVDEPARRGRMSSAALHASAGWSWREQARRSLVGVLPGITERRHVSA